MSTDLMSNMLSSIKNATLVRKEFIEIPFSKECESVCKVLVEGGYLENVKTFKPKGKAYKKLRIDFSYENDGSPKISEIKRVSRQGRRLYRKKDEIKGVRGGFGTLIVSTSRGVMAGEEARKKKLGGEVVCKVW